jgi:hypothetical protein
MPVSVEVSLLGRVSSFNSDENQACQIQASFIQNLNQLPKIVAEKSAQA